MGVPKFYRWISERYPCLSQVLKEYQIPQFDNMYLDMNGIIHPCSHPNDEDAHFRITEDEIFQNIFKYIEVLFRLIKPTKVFFMAVDGVAPRAKMNQQRARRFRSAMDAEKLAKEAVAKGETLPSEDRFDSNCITPGTEFMVKLQEQLKYFINSKISSDPAWQKVTVILSGHNVPGEGEHKIMEYIRWSKQQSDYDPNTRHCLYGLDADLMFLGLATHELHFSLLREEVKFGGKAGNKRLTGAEEQNFHLLHLSLFREYLDKEFECLKESLGEKYDLERIIDDFILLGFLVGNDFIPHLPDFHIHSNTLPILWKTYKEVRPQLDGYLHENGTIDLARFGTYLDILSRFDIERFEIQYEDIKWMAGKSEKNKKNKEEKATEQDELKAKFGNMLLGDSEDSDSDDQEEDMIMNEFKTVKKRYYVDKFNLEGEKASQDFMQAITFKYIEGLQWILWYYMRGVPSWSWYYPYHYAPYLSDIKNVADYKIDLQLGTPFLPFQQLMAVFPQGSKTLLPTALRELYSNMSPVIDFYPDTFPTDLNGKKQEWEAVTLIPFIEEDRLIAAMEPQLAQMTDDEKGRNTQGPCFVCTFDKSNIASYRSTLGAFPDVVPCLTNMDGRDTHCFRIAPEDLQYKMPAPSADPFRMGFPTMRHLKHTVSFDMAGCKIFQHASRDANCILNIDNNEEKKLEDYSALIGESVYVDFPHLVEARVTGVHNETIDYLLDGNCVMKRPADKGKKDCFKHVKSRECMSLKSRFGLEVGDVTVMIRVRKIRGKVPVVGPNAVVKLEKQWAVEDSWCPAQCIVSGIEPPIPVQQQSTNLSLPRMFPKGAKVFLVSNPGYGSVCEVNELTDDNKVKVSVIIESCPDLDELRQGIDSDIDEWFYAREMCSYLDISPFLLSKITSTYQIDISTKPKANTKFNVGIGIKYASKNIMAPGYSRKHPNGSWQYSKSCREILDSYKSNFPELFEELQNNIQSDNIKISDLFSIYEPEQCKEYIDKVRKYLKTLPIKNVSLIGVGSEMMLPQQMKRLGEVLTQHKESLSLTKMDLKVKPKVLFNPEFQDGILPPDKNAVFALCDRVVNVCSSHCVPFAMQGTVVGIKKSQTYKTETTKWNKGKEVQDQASDNTIYDVLFDKEFIGGRTVGDFTSSVYSMMPFMLINFTHGKRMSETGTNPLKAPKPKESTVSEDKPTEDRREDYKPIKEDYKPIKILEPGMGIEILQGGNKGPQKKREDKKKAPKAAPPKAAPKQRDHLEDQEEQWGKGNAYNARGDSSDRSRGRRGGRDNDAPQRGARGQRGGYNNQPMDYEGSRRGGRDDRQGYDGNRYGGYDGGRGRGYDNRDGGQGYNNKRGSGNNSGRGGGYDRGRGGYNSSSRGGYEDRGSYGYNQGGYNSPQFEQSCQGYSGVQGGGSKSMYSDMGPPQPYYQAGYQAQGYQDNRQRQYSDENRGGGQRGGGNRSQEQRGGYRDQPRDDYRDSRGYYNQSQQSQRRRREDEYEGSFYHGEFYEGRDNSRVHAPPSSEGYQEQGARGGNIGYQGYFVPPKDASGRGRGRGY